MNTFKRLFALSVCVIVLSSLAVYAQITHGSEAATQEFFWLDAGMNFCDEGICAGDGDPCSPNPPRYQFHNIWGTLFTFTHPWPVSGGKIIEWNVDTNRPGNLASGTFTIEVNSAAWGTPSVWPACPDPPQFMYGLINGTITIKFSVNVEPVPGLGNPLEDQRINFQGPMRIVGGTGFYEGIKGNGNMSGTYHDFDGPDDNIQFLITGRAKF